MKKIFLVLFFVFSMTTVVNAKNEVQKDNAPSECVKSSRAAVEALADEYGWDIHSGGSESDFAVEVFMLLYQDCLHQ